MYVPADTGDGAPRLTRTSQHHLEKLETEQIQMRNNIEALERNLNEASELRLVLQTLENFIRPPQRRGGAPSPAVSDIELGAAGAVGCGALTPSLPIAPHFGATIFVGVVVGEIIFIIDPTLTVSASLSRFGMVAGLVNRTKIFTMEEILWRATRGNMLFQTVPSREEFREAGSSEMVEKDAFAVFFQGERTRMKIVKISESFGGASNDRASL